MPEPTTRDVLHTLRRQMRRVRCRRNLYELQRAFYLLVAIGAGAAAAVVLLALASEETAFAAASWSVAAVAVLLAGWTALTTVRRWLGGMRAPSWIDRHASLKGRLATLVELGSRDEPLLPLLATQNARLLPTWEPERILPDSFPPAALAAALLASVALLATMVLAPRLSPPSPVASAHVRTQGASLRLGREADRLALATPEGEQEEDSSPLARLPGELQDRIRRGMRGKHWQAVLDASEYAARTQGRRDERPRAPADAAELERSWEIARTALSPRAKDDAAAAAAAGGPEGEQGERRAAQVPPPGVRGNSEAGVHGQPAAGAGTATDPNLLGPASASEPGTTTFELPLGARVRSQGGGPRPPSGDAPPAALDERPDLAARQRRDTPVLRIDVPPTYEGIVRGMFAHAREDAKP